MVDRRESFEIFERYSATLRTRASSSAEIACGCCVEWGRSMSGTLQKQVAKQRQIERTIMQGGARLCSPAFGRVCKTLWPLKTAEELASRVGCSIRAAGYEISGERHPSAQSILAVIAAITPLYRD